MIGRLIIHEAMAPQANMSIDWALLERCERLGPDAAPAAGFPVLRFYWWTEPTLSLGAKERLELAADAEACRRLGISLVRRPTGGRAVLHDDELTYSVVGPLGLTPFVGTVTESYLGIAKGLCAGLRELGIRADLTAGAKNQPGSHMPCFAAPSRYELVVGGRKIVGSAQRRLRRSVLQHGSILLSSGLDRLCAASGADAAARARLAGSITGVNEVLGQPVTRAELIDALMPHMRTALSAELPRGDLTESETQAGSGLEREGRFVVRC